MVKKKPYVLKKDTLISNILKDCPKAAEYLAEYGLLCITCPLSKFETLEDGAKIHSMNNRKIEKMIREINKKIEKST